MPNPFAWFDNMNTQSTETVAFFEKTFGWKKESFGPLTVIAEESSGPFASTCDVMNGVSGWVPYVEVDDLPAATDIALQNGAQMIAADVQGPAGIATFIRDPGGSAIALWKRSESK